MARPPLFLNGKLARILLLTLILGGAMVSAAQNLSEQYLLAAANQDRQAHQLPPVRMDGRLTAAALQHAREMAAHGTISHQFHGEPDLSARAGAMGVRFSLVTENVAEASNSALIHELWMRSAGHRANLLDPQVDSVGIAVVVSGGQLYAVEDFARSVEHLPLAEQEARVAELLRTSGLTLSQTPDTTQDARDTCRRSTGYAGLRQPWFIMRYTTADLHALPEELSAKLTTGRFREAAVGACVPTRQSPFSSYSIAVLLYP